jgi:hypothetical protein
MLFMPLLLYTTITSSLPIIPIEIEPNDRLELLEHIFREAKEKNEESLEHSNNRTLVTEGSLKPQAVSVPQSIIDTRIGGML